MCGFAAGHCGEACLAERDLLIRRGYASQLRQSLIGFIDPVDGEASLAALRCGKAAVK